MTKSDQAASRELVLMLQTSTQHIELPALANRASLVLINHHQRPVLFKIKINLQQVFSVHPHRGYIAPSATQQVIINLKSPKAFTAKLLVISCFGGSEAVDFEKDWQLYSQKVNQKYVTVRKPSDSTMSSAMQSSAPSSFIYSSVPAFTASSSSDEGRSKTELKQAQEGFNGSIPRPSGQSFTRTQTIEPRMQQIQSRQSCSTQTYCWTNRPPISYPLMKTYWQRDGRYPATERLPIALTPLQVLLLCIIFFLIGFLGRGDANQN